MISRIFPAIVLSFIFIGCLASDVERKITPPETFRNFSKSELYQLKDSSPFLKAHMKNGNLYLFDVWKSDETGTLISGHAILFNPMRDSVNKGQIVLGIDSVALLETNVIKPSGAATALTVFAGISAAVTVYCITNPKACFGSCPTFYVSDGDTLHLQAEGFSSSISPALEATDIDALYHARAINGEVSVEMRNEALETHVVRHVDLLALPQEKGCRVFYGTDGQFWESRALLAPDSARAPEGDCLTALRNADWNERFSAADEKYLGEKETIELKFGITPSRPYGIVIGCRQTLMPTYLLYQTLAYMGNDAGYWLAKLERKEFPSEQGAMEKLIGGIEVSVFKGNGTIQPVGVVDEHGPLAVDMHLIPLGEFPDTTLRVELRMTKGAWRIDYVGLAELSRPLQPIRIHPGSVCKNGMEDGNARAMLLDSTRVLVTFPGDTYTLKYALPDANEHYELFLESRGYYLEWMRKEWIEEQNPLFLAQIFLEPREALKRLAPEFKRVEPRMENCFWRSRYAKP